MPRIEAVGFQFKFKVLIEFIGIVRKKSRWLDRSQKVTKTKKKKKVASDGNLNAKISHLKFLCKSLDQNIQLKF